MPQLAVVVDDHPASRELARYLLAHAGLEVETASDGVHALSLIKTLQPDVVVLDLDIPGVDGCELRDKMAADPELAPIPIVVVSVYDIAEFSPNHTESDFAGYVRSRWIPRRSGRSWSRA